MSLTHFGQVIETELLLYILLRTIGKKQETSRQSVFLKTMYGYACIGEFRY